jgi:hypothetical protein
VTRRADALRAPLVLLAAGNIAASLLIRIWYRGSLFPGWDVMGVAEGVRLLATNTPSELLAYYRQFHGDLALWWNVYGVPATLLPAALNSLHPWLYWAHVSTFLCTAVAAALAARALPYEGRAIALVALGASPALLSWSIAGFPYISAAWPYALALYGVLRVRNALASLLIAVLACELSWHGQELGRTVFFVYALAALGAVRAPWPIRVVWISVAGAQAAYTVLHPTLNTMRWSEHTPLMHVLEVVPPMVRAFVFGTDLGRPDIPIIPGLGLLAALLVRTNRWLWRGLLAVHVALLAWLVANAGDPEAGALWPRRVLLVETLSILTIAVAAVDRPRWRGFFLAALLAGNVWQLRETLAWARSPNSPRAGFRYALPYSYANMDYYVPLYVTPWTDRILADVNAGRRVVLLYNLDSYFENPTDPTAIPERLYVALGHHRFTEHIAIFGSRTVRHHVFPIRPLADVDGVVNAIADPRDVVVRGLSSPLDAPSVVAEFDVVRQALEKRFRLVPAPTEHPGRSPVTWQRWILAPRAPG